MVYLYKTIPNSSIELITTSLILKRFLIRLFVWFLITFEGDLFVRGNDIEKVNKFVWVEDANLCLADFTRNWVE